MCPAALAAAELVVQSVFWQLMYSILGLYVEAFHCYLEIAV
jgi:hypothetical protein